MNALFPVDLHTHSTASDGKLSPQALVSLAARKGMRAIALTDHDTLDGLDEALAAREAAHLTVVPGIEISTRIERVKGFVGIHMLGYGIDYQQPALRAVIEKVQAGRLEQKVKQIEILQSFGFDIPVEAVLSTVAGVPGRPHIAAVLMARNPGHFETVQQVFDEYLGVGKKAHIGRSFVLSVAEAIELIHQADGLAVLAHPGVYDTGDVPLKTMIQHAVAEGLRGLEVYYPYGPRAAEQALVPRLAAIADELKLVKTGGTDYHARRDNPIELGDMGLEMGHFEALLTHLQDVKNGRSPN